MKSLLQFAALTLAPLLVAATCNQPPPVGPGGAGGAIATGGASGGGGVETAGSGGVGGTGGAAGSAGAVATGGVPVVAVAWPECSRTVKASSAKERSLSGWKRDPKRAKSRKFRPTYSVVAGSVFHQPNLVEALDQENLGSCTGNAVAHCLSTWPFRAALTEADAIAIYSKATTIDPWSQAYPPTDTGSNGSSAAKAAKLLGYTTVDFTPVVSLEELQGALQKTSCIVGVDWHQGFFSPANCGELAQSGPIAGGHEVQVIGWDRDLKVFWVRNSWGDWGLRRGPETGYAYFSAGTLQKLLNAGGEVDCPASVP